MGINVRGGGGVGGTSASIWDLSGTTIIYGADATAAAVSKLELGGGASTTPVNQTLAPSDALAGTAVDTSGAQLTIASGAGTGTGAVSTIIFRTPTVAAAGTGAQALATRLTISSASVLSTVGFVAPDGSASTGGYGFATGGVFLFLPIAGNLGIGIGGGGEYRINASYLQMGTNGLAWGTTSALTDLFLTRSAAATLQHGDANSAAPVAQTIQAQGSRSGTDTDIGGANLTIQPGTGTGTGTLSALIFQVPVTVASGTGAQTMAAALTLTANTTSRYAIFGTAAGTLISQVIIPRGSETAPGLMLGQVFGSADQEGIWGGNDQIFIRIGAGFSAGVFWDGTRGTFTIQSNGTYSISSTSSVTGAPDLYWCRDAAATFQHGAPNAAAPVSQIVQAQGSRAGTDTDTAGGNLTIRPGAGTGNATPSTLIFQAAVAVASGSGAQTMATRLTISGLSITATVPFLAPAGSEALPAFSFALDPDTGMYNPATNVLGFTCQGSELVSMGPTAGNNTALRTRSTYMLGWISTNAAPSGGTVDLEIGRSAAAILGLYGATASVGASLTLASDKWFQWSSTTDPDGTADLFLTRGGAAVLNIGPTAIDTNATDQSLQATGVLTGGTADQSGADLTILSGQGKGTGAISQLIFKTPTLGVSGTTLQTMTTRLTIDQNRCLVGNRLNQAKGADVAAANDLTLGVDGNTFTITGNTQINAITTANWAAGSKITLIFSGTPTVKHNTAGGAGTAVLFLAGSVDLVAAANTVLSLVYDGTQWQETSRKVA